MRVLAVIVLLAWLAAAVAMLRVGLWWAPVLTFLFTGGPALLYLWPAAKPDDTRRNYIVFRCTLPDDPGDADNGEPLPFGRPALQAIKELLASRGLSSSPVEHTRFYAWSIAVGNVEVLIQGDGYHLLAIADGRGFDEIVAAIQDAITRDDRFADVQVTTARGYDELPRATLRA